MLGPMISQRKTCASITTSVLLAASACFADTIFVTPGGPGGGANWGDATHFRDPGSRLAAQAFAATILADLAR